MDIEAYKETLDLIARYQKFGASPDDMAAFYRYWTAVSGGMLQQSYAGIEQALINLGGCPLVQLSVVCWTDGAIGVLSLEGHYETALQMRDVFIPAELFSDFVDDCLGWDDEGKRAAFESHESVVVSMLPKTWAEWLRQYESVESLNEETIYTLTD